MIQRQNRPSHYPFPKTRTEAQAGSNVPPGAERSGLRHAASFVRHGHKAPPLMQMNSYPLATVLAMFDARGFGSIVVDTEKHGPILTANLIAQKGR